MTKYLQNWNVILKMAGHKKRKGKKEKKSSY